MRNRIIFSEKMTPFEFFQSALKFRALNFFFQSELNFGTESTHWIFVLPSTLRVYRLTNNVLTHFEKKIIQKVLYIFLKMRVIDLSLSEIEENWKNNDAFRLFKVEKQ